MLVEDVKANRREYNDRDIAWRCIDATHAVVIAQQQLIEVLIQQLGGKKSVEDELEEIES